MNGWINGLRILWQINDNIDRNRFRTIFAFLNNYGFCCHVVMATIYTAVYIPVHAFIPSRLFIVQTTYIQTIPFNLSKYERYLNDIRMQQNIQAKIKQKQTVDVALGIPQKRKYIQAAAENRSTSYHPFSVYKEDK